MINGQLIKVCGMRNAENIRQVEALGVDMIGFIFYPQSPRFIYEIPAYLPTQASRVGVFVNENKDTILMYADRFDLEYIQLHGDESPEYCHSLISKGLKIIKAFPISRIKDLTNVPQYEGACSYLLFDAKSDEYGGSGNLFDWSILHFYKGQTPFLLSGGINLYSTSSLKNFYHPRLAGLDLNSRFETKPGEKDVERIKQFINNLKE